MPATPAWPPRSLPRLYVRQSLSEAARLQIDGPPAHYLGNVLRLKQGQELLLFDGSSGEWLARIEVLRKGRITVQVVERTRQPEVIPDVWLAFAPVKRAQTDWLVEKATELGVARLLPVITQRTIVDRVKLDRLQAIAVEAAEQCGRTRLPEIADPVPLARLLAEREPGRPLYFADETGGAPLQEALKRGPATILVGPEGGFAEEERAAVRASSGATAISLGPRILRAETAALAALAGFMALAGDWRS
jgi:16S rRNA (uracil1498-N3)-methyltransferase